jgi:hypothetical protein
MVRTYNRVLTAVTHCIGRPQCRWKDNIKIFLNTYGEIARREFVWIRIDTRGGLL